MKRAKASPSKAPNIGNKAWKNAKLNARRRVLFLVRVFCKPQVMDTVKESMERATERNMISKIYAGLILIYGFCYMNELFQCELFCPFGKQGLFYVFQ